MRNPKIAYRYAKSLLALSKERGSTDVVFADMKLLDDVISNSADLRAVLANPVLGKVIKSKALVGVFGSHVCNDTAAFLAIMVNKGREPFLGEVAEAYVRLVKIDRNVLSAELTTVFEANEALLAAVKNELSAIHKGEIEIVQKNKPEIVGGFKLKVGDKMIDAAITTKLNELRQEFLKNPYVAEY